MSIKHIKEKIKLVLADPKWRSQKKRILNHDHKTFFIIGGPVHGNLGDHAIMEEEKLFVKEYFPEFDCEEIVMPFYHTNKAFLRKHIGKSDIVCVSGGGWMGNLWFHNEVTIREIIKMFPENQIVIFPQTLYYSDDKTGKEVLKDTVEVFSSHNNLLLCVRDKQSLDLVEKYFELRNKSSYYYCPDMVFFGETQKPQMAVKEIVNVCIRDDCEALYKGTKDMIERIIPESYTVCEIDTVVPHRVSLNMRNEELFHIWKAFSEASLTITDRLHAMLFSYINGTPCIALDNKTGKVFGVYKWIENKGMVKCAESYQDISDSITTLLSMEHKPYDPMELRVKFNILAERIWKGMIK